MAFDFAKRKNNSGRVNNQAKSGNSNYSPFGSKQAFGKSTTVAAQGGAAQTGASAAAKKKQAMQGAVGTGATPGSTPQRKQNLFSPTSKASSSAAASSASSTLGGGVSSGGMSGAAPASATNYGDYKKQIDSLLSGTGGGIGGGGLSGQTGGATQGSDGSRMSGAGTGTPVKGDGSAAGWDVEDTPMEMPEEGGQQGGGSPFSLEQGDYQWGDEYDQYGQAKTWEYGVGNQIQQYQRGLNEELGDSWYDYQQQWFDQAAPVIPHDPLTHQWHSQFGIGPANPYGSPMVQQLFERWLREHPNASEEEIAAMEARFSKQWATPGGIGGFSSDKWRELEFGNYGMGSHYGSWGDPEDPWERGYQGGESDLLNKVFHMNIGPDSAFADKELQVSRLYHRAFSKPIIDWDEDWNPIYGNSPFESMKWRLNAPETEEVYATWKNLWGVTDEDIDQLRNIREDQIGTHWNRAMADEHERFLRDRLDLLRSKTPAQLKEDHPGMFIFHPETGEIISVSHWSPHHTAQILLDEPITFRGKRLIGEIQIEESMPEDNRILDIGGFKRPDRDQQYPGLPKMSYINADGDRIYIVEGPQSVWGGNTQNILSHHPKTGEPIVTGPDPRMDEANWEEFSWTSKFINLPPDTGENLMYFVRPFEPIEDAIWYAENWLNAYEMAKQSGDMGGDMGGGMGGDMGGDMGGGEGFIPGIDS